ncbi:hypothetical protein BASA50_004029 [Batrachochytrium salamandrivorans]|uniref:Transglutaminase-like domain-containing protein n=1 Tax=Batrachochytrium salamandrivorans TaxID=1357716 RepID=A0ABQ8FK33_9FUNG|nr:hypothetical protein BASA50_004029 [Batrachochytrium salamandrivorans]
MTPEQINQIVAQITTRFYQLQADRTSSHLSSNSPRPAPSSRAAPTSVEQLAAAFRSVVPASGHPLHQSRPAEQRKFLDRLSGAQKLVLLYENLDIQDQARASIPVDALHDEAHVLQVQNPKATFDQLLMKCLLKWFKGDSFKWVNQPPCDKCQGETVSIGATAPTSDDTKYGATTVELYKCKSCHSHTRFPRYNDPVKLLETRRGRCGEWANVFCLICRTMGFETRYILDFTDHVWTEVYDVHEKRWVHCDSCEGEGAYDTPLMYETGWGKKLTYIVAIGINDVVDVTRRYSRTPEIWSRRNLVNEEWISPALKSITLGCRRTLSESFRIELAQRDKEEELELKGSSMSLSSGDGLVGRQSGALEWREMRGEMGNSSPDKK